VLPRLPFLWCYGVFSCSISLRVVLVFKDIIYVIIILYIHDIWLSVSTFDRMCGTIDLVSCIRRVLGFGIKTRYDKRLAREAEEQRRHKTTGTWEHYNARHEEANRHAREADVVGTTSETWPPSRSPPGIFPPSFFQNITINCNNCV
jgi:Holliday junction resolvase-like predicted endonuclease